MRYSRIVDRMTAPRFRESMFFSTLPWRRNLTDEARALKQEMELASRVEAARAEQLSDRVVVTKWGAAGRKLICRVLTVFPDGRVTREDAVIGEELPLDQ